MKEFSLDGIERMYADDLFDAAESDQPTWITRDGERVAVIVPVPVITAIIDALREPVRNTLSAIASAFGIQL